MVVIHEENLTPEHSLNKMNMPRKVHISAKKEHALSTLTNAVSPEISRNFSDVTLVFSDGVVEYYRCSSQCNSSVQRLRYSA